MNTTKKPPYDILKTPVNRMLFMMATPISLGMLSTFLFQVVDTFFVGRLGSAELAALAFASTIYFLLVGIFVGMSVGVSSVIAKASGEQNHQKVKQLATLSLLLTVLLSGAISIIGYFTVDIVFGALGADSKTLTLIREYMQILYISFPLLMIGIVGSGIIRATGVIRLSEIIFGIAGIINLVFDYLLIFGIGAFPELEFKGAAMASALSFAFIFIGLMFFMFQKKLISMRAITSWIKNITAYREILRLALPSVGMQMLVPVIGMFVIFLLSRFGSEIVAAYGVAARIEALALVGIFAVSMSVTPFIAQNFGAKKYDRIDEAIVFAGKTSVYLGLLLFLVLAIFGSHIAKIFSTDSSIIQLVSLYFKIVAISYGLYGIMNVTSSIFNGLQMPQQSLRISLVKTFVFSLPLIIIGSFFSAGAIFAALVVSNILGGLYAGVLMRRSMRKWNRPLAKVNVLQSYLNDIKRLLRIK